QVMSLASYHCSTPRLGRAARSDCCCRHPPERPVTPILPPWSRAEGRKRKKPCRSRRRPRQGWGGPAPPHTRLAGHTRRCENSSEPLQNPRVYAGSAAAPRVVTTAGKIMASVSSPDRHKPAAGKERVWAPRMWEG